MQVEKIIARCRVFLALAAFVAVYVDPTAPMLLPILGLRGGAFAIDPAALAVLSAYLVSSVAVYAALVAGLATPRLIAALTTVTDVLFAAAIAAVTEGVSSPFYVFFVFAVTAAGFRGGSRRTAGVIVAAVGLYLSLILLSREVVNFYVMRPVYLAIIGYLIFYLARRRAALEDEVRLLARHAERRQIATALHDGSVQTLVAVTLRLEGCQDLLRAGHYEAARDDLCALEAEIVREYEALRAYTRDLAHVERTIRGHGALTEPSVSIDLRFAGSPALIDEILQMTREAISNVRRHAGARTAAMSVRDDGTQLVLAFDDDGVGYPADTPAPWSIASRVEAAGGALRVERRPPGTHLRITLPRAATAA